MDGVHDCGGQHGYGQINPTSSEPVFHHDWERRVMGTMSALWFTGFSNFDEARASVERMGQAEYLTTTYYEHFMHFVEDILVEKGVVTQDELEAGKVLTSGKGSEIMEKLSPDLCWPYFQHGASMHTELPAAAKFKEGDRVFAKDIHPQHHTRTPRYCRGRVGTIEMVHGAFGFSDKRSYGEDEPQYLYSVRFEPEDLFGPEGTSGGAEGKGAVYLDMYETYLEPEA